VEIYSIARQRSTYLAFAFAASGLTLPSGAAIAQQQEEISVAAPPLEIVRKHVDRNYGGARTEEVTISYQVAYGDLDLKRSADVETLNKRVSDAAKVDCSKLARLLPFTWSPMAHWNCVRRAMSSAAAQIDAATAAANGSATYSGMQRP